MTGSPTSSRWSVTRCTSCLGVVGECGTVAVAGGEVLGPHGGAVGCLPEEPGLGDRRGHAPPDHGVGEPGQPEDLGHLCDVAEHVGQVADGHGAAEGRMHGRGPSADCG